jgi:NADH-quinone oxidoreductase subunit C
MTEQPPSEGAESAAAPEGQPAPAAHRGPPIVIAEEILNERGEDTAAIVAKLAAPHVLESGGRDDNPWVKLDAEHLHVVAAACRDSDELGMDMLHLQFAVDYIEHIQVVYALYSVANDRKVMLKVDLPPESPAVASVTDLWIAATWYERETHDLFGVDFPGNDDLSPLLLYEGFEGFPGLKSFPFNEYEEW